MNFANIIFRWESPYAFYGAHDDNIGWNSMVFVLFEHKFALFKASSTGKSDDLVILSANGCDETKKKKAHTHSHSQHIP